MARLERGEEIVIARNGTPIAVLGPDRRPGAPRRPGTCRGAIHIAEDVDAPDPAIEALFAGDER